MLEEIKEDLLNMTDVDIVKKYLLSTDVWYFTEYQKMTHDVFLNTLDIMNKIISDNLAISMKNILIVGSGKTGYSFAPHKALKKFDSDSENESDIDIAIISDRYFNECWELIRGEIKSRHSRYYNEIASGIFSGFISKNALDEIPSVRREWNNKVSVTKKSLKEKINLEHPINFRIYRSWEDLEYYHVKGVKKLRKVMEDK